MVNKQICYFENQKVKNYQFGSTYLSETQKKRKKNVLFHQPMKYCIDILSYPLARPKKKWKQACCTLYIVFVRT